MVTFLRFKASLKFMKKQWNLIAPVALVILAALALAGWRTWGPHKSAGGWPELKGGVYSESVTSAGLQYLVPPDEIYASGLSAEDRPALVNPSMVDVSVADVKLADDLEGIAVTVGNQQRFYPFQILNWHEVVLDQTTDENLLITYSSLTGSAVVYDAAVAGPTDELHSMQDAGKVYNNAMLMVDGYGTLWNQTTGQAVVGETVGQKLEIYPSVVMSWADWKDLHPDGLAMSTGTGYSRDYGRHPFGSYETSPGIFFPSNYVVPNVATKDIVYRLDLGSEPVVFLERYVPLQEDTNVDIEVELGTISVVAFYDEALQSVRVFNRQQPLGTTYTFEQRGGKITDKETGSTWSATGLAVAGKLRGTQLEEMSVTRHYAFAHFAMYPNSIISGEELLPKEETE